MTEIDLQSERRTGTWVRKFGVHEDAGVHVSLGSASAHVEIRDMGPFMFAIDRADIPSAYAETIDIPTLCAELMTALVARMSVRLLDQLFAAVRNSVRSARAQGAHEARLKIHEALGIPRDWGDVS